MLDLCVLKEITNLYIKYVPAVVCQKLKDVRARVISALVVVADVEHSRS